MRLRFTIRDLFWLTLVSALTVGWWLDQKNLMQQLDANRRLIDGLVHANSRYSMEMRNIPIQIRRAAAAGKPITIPPPASR